MKQPQFAKRLLTLALLLGLTALLVGQPVMVDAQSDNPNAYGSDAGSPDNSIYVTSDGKVGIGTTEPLGELDIKYSGSTTHNVRIEGNPADSPHPYWHSQLALLGSDEYSDARLTFATTLPSGSFAGTASISTVASDANGGELLVRTRKPGLDGNWIENMRIKGNGTIGIGTSNPQAQLEIFGGPDWVTDPNGFIWQKSIRIGNKNAMEFVTGGGGDTHFGIGARNSPSGLYFMMSENASSPDAQATFPMMISRFGRVGINTDNPQTQLHIAGTTTTSVLQITGGADLAEPFAINDTTAVEPGTVVILDTDNPGELRVANGAYDPLVAGVISGAGNIQPGLIMQQEEEATVNGEMHPVALTGKVYVKAVGPIQIGDLLTTADTPGHAMAAGDRDRAFGATLGKAMSVLDVGEMGLVLVLVALQ